MKDRWNKDTSLAHIQGLGEISNFTRKYIAQQIYDNLPEGYTGEDIKDAVEDKIRECSKDYEKDFNYEFAKAMAKIPKPYSEFISTPEINWFELVLTCNMNELLDMVQELVNAED